MATINSKKLLMQILLTILIISVLNPLIFADSGSSKSGNGSSSGSSSAGGVISPVTVNIDSLITKEKGTSIKQLYLKTLITANKEPLPPLKEYICIYGFNNQLKSTAVIDVQTYGDNITTNLTGSFDIKEDYVKIFVWDDNMIPYCKVQSTLLNDISRTVIPASAPGWGGDSRNGS